MARTLSAVAREAGGELVGEDSAFEGVSIDSRELKSGADFCDFSEFVALCKK